MTKTAYIDFKALKDKADFRQVLDHYGIEVTGREPQLKIKCPFHDDKNPSCGVNTERKLFNCFVCGAGGDIINFVTRMEGFDPDTERHNGALVLAKIVGFETESKGKKPGKGKTRKKPKAKKEEEQLPESPKENKRLDLSKIRMELTTDHPFFESHSITPEMIKTFGLGYTDVGILKGRIVIPIHNIEGDIVAFAGRFASEVIPEGQSRYRLPKNFHRGLELFNIHRAKEHSKKHVVVVEGYWSAMRLHLEGVPVVATCGTSISKEQISLLSETGYRFITVLYDGDDEGRKASETVVSMLAGSNMYVRRLDLPHGVKPDTMDDTWIARLKTS